MVERVTKNVEGELKAGKTNIIKFPSEEPMKSGANRHMISTSCWCTSAYWKDGELILEYVPKAHEVGKTVSKNATVTYPDRNKTVFEFTASISS